MAEKRGIQGNKVVGKPYSLDGVYVDEIAEYSHDQ